MPQHSRIASYTIMISIIALVSVSGRIATSISAQPALSFDRTDYRVGQAPQGVTAGDFNGDRKIDLAVANVFSGTVSILLGDGNGMFGPKTDFPAGSSASYVTTADFNHDANLDLAVTNSSSHSVKILLGTGSGAFSDSGSLISPGFPFQSAAADFNFDGNLDLVVTNNTAHSVSLYPGAGNGTFGSRTDLPTGGGPRTVAISDFNLDGFKDLAVANSALGANSVSVLIGVAAGLFGPRTDFPTGPTTTSVNTGDFNLDGRIDLVTTNGGVIPGSASILLGHGNGTFGANADFGVGNGPSSVAVADYDRDLKMDLAIANADTVSVLTGNGDGRFNAKVDFAAGASVHWIHTADFNDDGRPDFVTGNRGSDTISVFLNTTIVNRAPVAKAADRMVEADLTCTTNASVDNGSYDPDGDPIFLSQTPAGPYGLGSTVVTLTVRDIVGATDAASATVTVVDRTPPTVNSLTAIPNELWPPNGKMIPIELSAAVFEACSSPTSCRVVAVTSNEPPMRKEPDYLITGNLNLVLRAERSGQAKDGRIYTIVIECTDASGNSTTRTVTVIVPHDRGK